MCTGLEPLFAFAGSAAPALATVAGAAGAGLLAKQAVPKQPPAVQPLTAADKPQTAKGPDRAVVNAQNTALTAAAGAKAGNAGTFLTGPSGIDASTLNLGKNTLLGE